MKKINSLAIDNFSVSNYGIILKNKSLNDTSLPVNNEIAICEKWLYEFAEPQKSFNYKYTSYGLKHQVEKWAGKYVSNGAFIFAALSLKFPIKAIENGPNAIFGLKLLTPEEKWKHIYPIRFSRWLFRQKNEDTVIGDLARDAVDDKKWPRRAEFFVEFWEYFNCLGVHHKVMDSLCLAWEKYSGRKAPAPTERERIKCESFYEDEVDIIHYGDTYSNAEDGYTFIYVLFEEVGKNKKRKARYIGQSVCPSQRLQQHTVTPGNLEKVKWVGGLLNIERKPLMAIVDCVRLEEAIHMERVYINVFISCEKRDNQPYSDVLLNKSLI